MPPEEYCLLQISHWSTCMAKAEWAAWVQAIFSVVAIFAATWIASRQNRNAVRLQAALRRAEAERQLDIAIALADRAVWLLEQAPNPETSDSDVLRFWAHVSQRDYQLAAVDLRKIGPEQVPTGSVLNQITSLASLLDEAVGILGDMAYKNRLVRETQREVWNGRAKPFLAMRELARANRAVLRSVREHL